MTTHWTRHLRHWQLLGPPLRPHPQVIERVRTLLGPADARCLLLGATVEYAALRPGIIALDASLPMLAALWRSSDPSGQAIQADWTRMPIAARSFSHVLGDGSLNAVASRFVPALLDEVTRVLRPQGSLIARVFCRPETAESADDIRRDLLLGRIGSFHALKWRVAMSVLPDRESDDVAVTAIRDAINAQYPDRQELSRLAGWSRAEIDTLDVYEGSDAVYNFPTEWALVAQLRERFADVESVRCGAYPLAERCPLVVARRPFPRGP